MSNVIQMKSWLMDKGTLQQQYVATTGSDAYITSERYSGLVSKADEESFERFFFAISVLERVSSIEVVCGVVAFHWTHVREGVVDGFIAIDADYLAANGLPLPKSLLNVQSEDGLLYRELNFVKSSRAGGAA
ncbi:hypothetical protein [Pseudomonas luteola]|uniref:hypothetical protein n=1 Tax=Pseudomonas luteola TaxID=47886 RepID=UPI0012392492|nr:hypothetical protein [Pseudomonas luteola]QEU28822.1 hypothetical protein FOB45_13950 [Pseudomonas luteola]